MDSNRDLFGSRSFSVAFSSEQSVCVINYGVHACTDGGRKGVGMSMKHEVLGCACINSVNVKQTGFFLSEN